MSMASRFFTTKVPLPLVARALALLLLSVSVSVTLSSATNSAPLNSNVHSSDAQANSLSLNLSYWRASSSFSSDTGLTFSVVQLPSVNGSNYPDEIFVMGGATYFNVVPYPFNNTWKSVDEGNSWTQVATVTPFTSRYGAAVCATPESNILIIGGQLGAPNFTGATDSYMSRDRGVTWELVSSKQPFVTKSHTSCTVDSTGKFVFLWVGTSKFSNVTQLYRAPYSADTGIGEWVGIATPAADGQPLDSRSQYAIQFLPHSNQLIIGGGNGPDAVFREVLSLTLPVNNQNVSAWTRTVVNADWPTSLDTIDTFLLDSQQNLYFFTQDQYWNSLKFSLWRSASTTEFDSWIPIDISSSCGVTWDTYWSQSIGALLTSSAGGSNRLLVLDETLASPTLMVSLDLLDLQSLAFIMNEKFVPVTACPAPAPDAPPSHLSWQIIAVISVACLIVIGCATYFISRMCRKPQQHGINFRLLDNA